MLLAVFLILISGSGIVTAAEISVQPGDSIQTAVNNATSGDEIIIKPGTYTENIVIKTDGLVVRSESGDPENTIIKARSSGAHALSVQADNVRISGFKITGTKTSYTGIQLSGCNNCIIENNKLLNNGYGIYLLSSRGSTVSNNIITNNGDYGIVLASSTGSTLSGNTVSNNNGRGVHLGTSDDNILSGNNIASNGISGLYICPRSDNNLVFNNYLVNTVNAEIKNGTGNAYSTEKTAGKNIVGGPNLGGNFWGKPDGSGFSETAPDTDGDGIADVAYSFENSIYADSLPLVYVAEKPVEGPTPVLPIANLEASLTNGHAPLSVRFTDLSENAVEREWDFDNDEKTDSIDKSTVYVYATPGTYTAKLTVSNDNGTDSKTATITVTEKNEDNLGDSGTGNNETVSNETMGAGIGSNGTGEGEVVDNGPENSEVAGDGSGNNETGDSVSEEGTGSEDGESSSGGSSHSSSSSSGGDGGSPESAKNVEAKEISQVFITNGKEVKFDFVNNATCVVSVGFDAKKTAGKTTTVVEVLKGKSSLVSNLPSDEVYEFFNIWVGNSGYASSKNIENSVICFKVEKAWMQENRIESSSIALNRYDDEKWEQLPVTILKEDNEFIYFTAESTGFSSFAITGKANTFSENVTESGSEPETRSVDQKNTKSTGLTAEMSEQVKSMSQRFEILSGITGLLSEWIEHIRDWAKF
ncbi:MAG: PGF-pre-PGF domain-containing protein [Methanosarcina sp.]